MLLKVFLSLLLGWSQEGDTDFCEFVFNHESSPFKCAEQWRWWSSFHIIVPHTSGNGSACTAICSQDQVNLLWLFLIIAYWYVRKQMNKLSRLRHLYCNKAHYTPFTYSEPAKQVAVGWWAGGVGRMKGKHCNLGQWVIRQACSVQFSMQIDSLPSPE